MRRYHLSKKRIKEIRRNLAMDVWVDGTFEIIEDEDLEIVLIDGSPVFFLHGGKYYPTVILLLNRTPQDKYVTVDMGAVKHVLNGANIFSAGIVDADEGIAKGDCVYVRDVKYLKPLAVGIAEMNGKDMVREKKGLAVKSLHHYGDKIFDYS